MVFDVSTEILGRTTNCHRDFGCLDNGACQRDDHERDKCVKHCEIDRYVSDDLLFIKPEKGATCSYMLSYGYSHLCRCPVRAELFKKHKI